MSKVSLGGSATGTATFDIVAPATNTNRTITLPDSSGQVSVLDLRTAVTASGTAVDFLNIPATARRITVMFSGVSTNGTSGLLLQIGTVSGVEVTGYSGTGASTDSSAAVTATFTAGFGICRNFLAANTANGIASLCLVAGNIWAESSNVGLNSSILYYSAGTKTLSGTLDRIRITTVNGTDVFDAGTINIMVE